MNPTWDNPEQRLLELLADRATFGLDAAEQRELRRLLDQNLDFDESCMDRVAAAAHLAMMPADFEPLPPGLRQRIAAGAGEYLSRTTEPGLRK